MSILLLGEMYTWVIYQLCLCSAAASVIYLNLAPKYASSALFPLWQGGDA